MAEQQQPLSKCSARSEFEKKCQPKCLKYWKEYSACGERIKNFDKLDLHDLQHKAEAHGISTHTRDKQVVPKETLIASLSEIATCGPQYFEYFHCMDGCVAPKLFAQLK